MEPSRPVSVVVERSNVAERVAEDVNSTFTSARSASTIDEGKGGFPIFWEQSLRSTSAAVTGCGSGTGTTDRRDNVRVVTVCAVAASRSVWRSPPPVS